MFVFGVVFTKFDGFFILQIREIEISFILVIVRIRRRFRVDGTSFVVFFVVGVKDDI